MENKKHSSFLTQIVALLDSGSEGLISRITMVGSVTRYIYMWI